MIIFILQNTLEQKNDFICTRCDLNIVFTLEVTVVYCSVDKIQRHIEITTY